MNLKIRGSENNWDTSKLISAAEVGVKIIASKVITPVGAFILKELTGAVHDYELSLNDWLVTNLNQIRGAYVKYGMESYLLEKQNDEYIAELDNGIVLNGFDYVTLGDGDKIGELSDFVSHGPTDIYMDVLISQALNEGEKIVIGGTDNSSVKYTTNAIISSKRLVQNPGNDNVVSNEEDPETFAFLEIEVRKPIIKVRNVMTD